ncbi:MAG: dehydrogenase [Gammaproteobacteria bacterium]|nr:dehydrogenase [Gammaproteobacteria bacterium]
MKQILQNLKTGETLLVEVPSPSAKAGYLKIKTNLSLISAGTEGMLVGFGKSGYLDKARQQPEKVAQVINKISTDGLKATVDTVMTRLDEPQPLGYSNVGVVIEVGDGVDGYSVGDRVVSNGRHAEIVNVPHQLCAKIPDSVSDEMAAFTVVSSIGLQGVRLAQPTIGETIVVFGLGLIGLLTAQVLKANGCRVLGFDVSDERVEMARGFGIEASNIGQGGDPVSIAMAFSDGVGVDAVIITASTKDDSIISSAAQMARKRGRIVLVGVVGLKLNRADFYEKELSFQVSCSYGPGRYDSFYEEEGNDYPIGFVRWTEQRNFYAILNMMDKGQLVIDPLVSLRVPIEKAASAYDKLVSGNVVTIIMNYPDTVEFDTNTINLSSPNVDSGYSEPSIPKVGVIGAGNFTKARLLPALKKSKAMLHTIASAQGVSSASGGSKYGFKYNTNDLDTIWNNDEIDTVFVTTRHNLHAKLVSKALQSNKNIFVEKPLCLTKSELDDIRSSYYERRDLSGIRIMVGFNRRFAPLVKKMKLKLKDRAEPLSIIYTINAGYIPADHWTQDIDIGGGRIIGEACHFIDLMQYLVGRPIVSVFSLAMGGVGETGASSDKMTINLEFEDGSHGAVHYFANGSKTFPKERVEVFSEGRVFQLDNFRKLNISGDKLSRRFDISHFKPNLSGQDKGHEAGFIAFLNSILKGEDCPISFEEIENTMRATFAAVESAKEGKQKKIPS